MLWCIKDKGTEFLLQGLLRLPGDKSTWAVMLFRKKGAAGATVPASSCLSCTISYRALAPPTSFSPSPITHFWLEPSTFGYNSQPLS